jgi:autotransporter-associated beta strand protein
MNVNRSHGNRSIANASPKRQVLLTAVLAVPIVAAAAGSAYGVPNKFNYHTGSGTQSWFDPAGWSEGTPTAEDQVRVSSNATLEIDAAGAIANNITFGYGNNLTPTLNVKPGGTLFSANDIIFGGSGVAATSANVLATLNQTGGDILIPANRIFWLGFGGNAVHNMSGGTLTVGRPAFSSNTNLGYAVGTGVAGLPTNTSTLNMSAGTMNIDAVFEVARGGASGVMNLTGGTLNVGSDFQIGQGFGLNLAGQGTVTHSGGTINTGFNQPGQTNFGNFFVGVGNPADKRASYTLSGSGVINAKGFFEVGGGLGGTVGAAIGGYGDFVMNGGAVNVNNSLMIGWAQGAQPVDGVMTVNGGTVTMALPAQGIVVGNYQANAVTPRPAQNGTMNISGGQVLNPLGVLEIGRDGATGTLNLSGGQLAVDSFQWRNPAGNTNVRAFNFTGGTLDANSAVNDYPIANNGGTLRPGGATTTRVFTANGTDGSYVQNTGALKLDLASAADYDALDLSAGGVGAANLSGGTVDVSAIGGFAPSFGVTIPAVTAKTITDSATWNLPTLTAGNTWDKRVSADGANQVESLTVVRSSASTLSSGSTWSTATWSSGTPNAADASAKLAGAGGSISVDAPVTVGYLQLDGSGAGWTVNGASTLTIATSGGAAGGIVAFGGANEIAAPVAFNSNAAIATQLQSTAVTLSGDVSGAAVVEKTGPGSLNLTSATSPFAGTWKISGGALNVASDANLGAPAATLSLNKAALNVSGPLNTARSIALSGINTITTGGDSMLSGVISGTGGLTKADTNVLVLAAANTYSGPSNVTAGTLRQGAAHAVPAASALTLAAGTTFDLAALDGAVGSIAGAGSITTAGANFAVGNDNTSTAFSGVVSGGGTFTKNGAGTLTFSRPAGAVGGIVPVDGSIVVNGGVLRFNGLNQGTYDLPANDIVVNAGGNLWLHSAVPNGGAFFNQISGAGKVTIDGFLVTLTSANTHTGGTDVVGGAVVSITDMGALGPDGTLLHFRSTGTRDNSFAGGIWFEIGDHVTPVPGTFSHPMTVDAYKSATFNARGNDITVNAAITGGGTVVWQSSNFSGSTFRVNVPATYKGVTQIDPAVRIILGADNALPPNATAVNGALDMNGHDLTLAYLVSFGAPTIDLTDATLTLNNEIEQQFGGQWTGTISGTGQVIKTGGGTQVFTLPAGAASAYTGGTVVDRGTLQIVGNVNALPVTGGVTINGGGSLQFTTTAAASGLAAGAPVAYAGNISGTGEVQITTLERVVLSGTNTYSGGTRISNGTLLVNEDDDLGAPTGKITFHSNGSNPGPILMFGGNVTSARDIVLENGTGFVDTNGFDVTVGNIDGNVTPPQPLGSINKIVGAGTLTAKHVRANAATVSVGTLAIAPSGGVAAAASRVNSLTIAADARFDLKDNKLITNTPVGAFSGGAYNGVHGEVQRAYHSGAWDLPGLMTSMPDAGPTIGTTTIGVATAQTILFIAPTATGTWAGQSVTGTTTLAMYTYAGDLNFDGRVDAQDYGIIDNWVQFPGTNGYANGDINYDGVIDAADYGIIDNTIQLQGPPIPAGGGGSAAGLSGVTAVPEPTSLAAFAVAAAALMRRGRRRQRRQE